MTRTFFAFSDWQQQGWAFVYSLRDQLLVSFCVFVIKDAGGKSHLLCGVRIIYQTPENNPNLTLILIRGGRVSNFLRENRGKTLKTQGFSDTLCILLIR